ncbi:MAG TPA: sigma-54 dependent transcriptional regulator [Candidatus Methylacidiphilales bacterium]|nr:sigma-54 dependent transcriptional regulator [Candidatus Methylacidiphilales bacterium]
MGAKPLIGIIDDERNVQATLAAILERRGYAVWPAFTAKQGLQMIAEQSPEVVLLDLGLPDSDGLGFLRTIKQEYPGIPVIVVTANDSLNNAIASIKEGAFHFISKPYVPEELISLVGKALEHRGLRRETMQLRQETERLKKRVQRAEAQLQVVFKNSKMQELFELVDQVAPSDASVLVVGESGVGKEIFANRIHEQSPRHEGPLIKLNCAAFPQNMIEGELFGYKKGAFTGASQDFPGMLGMVGGGTLFLDEIAEMPVDLQTRFLRVLQEREYRPLGSTQVLRVDFRLVAASNRRPEDAIRSGRLREDLFYRLNTFTLHIPPLRERTEDIPELAQLFLQRFCAKMNKPPLTIQSEVYDALLRYHWPGNVRQLQNVIERAVVLTQGSMITPRNLPHEVVHATPYDPATAHVPAEAPPEPGLMDSPSRLRQLITESQSLNLAEREKAALMAALEQCNGNKKKAAELLGIHRPTLYTKLRKFGLGV